MITASAQPLVFSCSSPGAGPLEGMLTMPKPARGNPGVVLCHWSPCAEMPSESLLGALAESLATAGSASLRLNLGGTQQQIERAVPGAEIQLDLAGAVEFLLSRPGVHGSSVFFVGHGLGCFAALTCARADRRVAALALVSPPLYLVREDLMPSGCPTLLLTGELDEVCPPEDLAELSPRLATHAMIETIPGARHMLREHEEEAATLIRTFLELHTAAAAS